MEPEGLFELLKTLCGIGLVVPRHERAWYVREKRGGVCRERPGGALWDFF